MMRFLLSIFFVCSICLAGEKADISKIVIEKTEKEKAARIKLLNSLKTEEKAAQRTGNLALIQLIKNRIAEIEDMNINPFDDKKELKDEHVIKNSPAEGVYSSEITVIDKTYTKRIYDAISQMKSKRDSLTKSGKIDEASALDEEIATILNDMKIPDQEYIKYVGSWKKQTGTSLTIKYDFTYSCQTFDNKTLSGSWKIHDKNLILSFKDKDVILKEVAPNVFEGKCSQNKDYWKITKSN